MIPDRAVLDPGDAEVYRRELDAGDPQRRELVPLPAADERATADLVSEPPGYEGPAGHQRRDDGKLSHIRERYHC